MDGGGHHQGSDDYLASAVASTRQGTLACAFRQDHRAGWGHHLDDLAAHLVRAESVYRPALEMKGDGLPQVLQGLAAAGGDHHGQVYQLVAARQDESGLRSVGDHHVEALDAVVGSVAALERAACSGRGSDQPVALA